jgi:hypothetical protein
MTDNTLDRKPGEKAPGKYHYNPGNMAGKTVETGQDAGQLHPDACGQGMASEGLEGRLHELDRHVALGEEQILRHRAIIVDLEGRGDDAKLAKEQLPGGLRVLNPTCDNAR